MEAVSTRKLNALVDAVDSQNEMSDVDVRMLDVAMKLIKEWGASTLAADPRPPAPRVSPELR